MPEEEEITSATVAESLGVVLDDEPVEDGDEELQETEEEGEDDAEEPQDIEEHEEPEDGDGEEESDPDSQQSPGGDKEQDVEEKQSVLTPEHQVGAGIERFLSENIAPDRVQEGMAHFQSSLGIVAAQMKGDYEGYWSGITPSIQQAAMDNPASFMEQIGPLYEQVMFGTGRALTPENRRRVDDMEISQEMALKMQQQDHEIKMSQRNVEFFQGKQAQSQEQHKQSALNNEISLSVRETMERLEAEHPRASGVREKLMEQFQDSTPTSPEQAAMLVENAFLREINAQNRSPQKNRQVKKNPLRSNKKAASRKVERNPDVPNSPEEIAESLNL